MNFCRASIISLTLVCCPSLSICQAVRHKDNPDSLTQHKQAVEFQGLLVKVINTYNLSTLSARTLDRFVQLFELFWADENTPEVNGENYGLMGTAFYRLCNGAGQNDAIVESMLRLHAPPNSAEGSEMTNDIPKLLAQSNPRAFVREFTKRDLDHRIYLAYALRDSLPQSYDAVAFFRQFALSPEGKSVRKEALELAKLIYDQRSH